MKKRYIGDSGQSWKDIENGYHVNAGRRKIDVRQIDYNYALNLRNWYLRIKMSDDERERLKQSKMFKVLDEIAGTISFEEMIELGEEVRVAKVKYYGDNCNYSIRLTDEDEVNVGDTVVIGEKNKDQFEHLNIGLVEQITKTSRISLNRGELIDVITDSSAAFVNLKNKRRKEEIKREIQERIKVVDERQEMEMYAKADKGIKDLLDELDQMKD